MKLSELVAYYNQLNALSAVHALSAADIELAKIIHLVKAETAILESCTHDLEQRYATIQQSFSNFEQDLDNLKSQLKLQIAQAEKPWFQESYTLYEDEISSPADDILKLRKAQSLDDLPFRNRLSQYADWKYPAIIIRPGMDRFIEDMVAYDPLYLVDLCHDYLKPALDHFNQQYQNRLRLYIVSEDLNQEALTKKK